MVQTMNFIWYITNRPKLLPGKFMMPYKIDQSIMVNDNKNNANDNQ